MFRLVNDFPAHKKKHECRDQRNPQEDDSNRRPLRDDRRLPDPGDTVDKTTESLPRIADEIVQLLERPDTKVTERHDGQEQRLPVDEIARDRQQREKGTSDCVAFRAFVRDAVNDRLFGTITGRPRDRPQNVRVDHRPHHRPIA